MFRNFSCDGYYEIIKIYKNILRIYIFFDYEGFSLYITFTKNKYFTGQNIEIRLKNIRDVTNLLTHIYFNNKEGIILQDSSYRYKSKFFPLQ